MGNLQQELSHARLLTSTNANANENLLRACVCVFAYAPTPPLLLATIKLRAISLLNTYQHKSVVQLNALKMKRKIEFSPPFLRAPLEMRIKLLSRCFLSYNNNTTNYSCRRKNHKFSVTKLAAALYFRFPRLPLRGAAKTKTTQSFH